MDRTLIAYATVVTLDEGRVHRPGWIGVEDGRIAFVDERPPGDPAWLDAPRIDAAGKIALPGLVNAHAHVGMTVMRGAADDLALMPWLREKIWPMESAMNAEDRYWSGRLACLEMLRGGITCFADMGPDAESAWRAADQTGIRALLGEVLFAGQDEDRSLLGRARDFAVEKRGHGRLRVGLAPHAQYTCSVDYLEDVAAAAGDFEGPLQIHLAETPAENADCRAEHGLSATQLLDRVGLFARPAIAAHCIELDEADREILARRGVSAAHNPSSNMKLGNGVLDSAALEAAGVNLCLGTDSTASNNNLSLFTEMRMAALLQKSARRDPTALPAARVLEMATLGGARALGLEDRIGKLAPGFDADIVLLRGDGLHAWPLHDPVSHLVYALGAGDVDRVMVAGETLLEDGRFTRLSAEETLARCGEIAARLGA